MQSRAACSQHDGVLSLRHAWGLVGHYPRLLLKPLFNSFLYISSFCIICVVSLFLVGLWLLVCGGPGAQLRPCSCFGQQPGCHFCFSVIGGQLIIYQAVLPGWHVVSMCIRLHRATLQLLEVNVLAWVQWNMRREPTHDPRNHKVADNHPVTTPRAKLRSRQTAQLQQVGVAAQQHSPPPTVANLTSHQVLLPSQLAAPALRCHTPRMRGITSAAAAAVCVAQS